MSETPVGEPQWIDGMPANLPAAIADALEWLDLLGRRDWLNQENRERVRGCAAALRNHANHSHTPQLEMRDEHHE